MTEKTVFMVSAIKSGSGKTLITLGLANLFKRSGKTLSMFKTGPDYIDTMYHSKITGRNSTNLDPFFLEPDFKPGELRKLFFEFMDADVGIIEGAMGLFDGIYGEGKRGSAHVVSVELNVNVILVVEIDEIDSLLEYLSRYTNNVKAVFVNKVPKGYDIDLLKKRIDKIGLKLLGYLFFDEYFHIESRHLGLSQPTDSIYNTVNKVSDEIFKSLSFYVLSDFMMDVNLFPDIKKTDIKKKKYRLAYAFDEAFSFSYNTNIDVLEEFGFEIIKFSPIHDSKLPENISVLWLSGGYPELYARELSQNTQMIKSIQSAKDSVIIAECGGFIYLHDSFQDINKKEYPGVGLIKGSAFKTEKLVRFGYIDIKARRDTVLLKQNQRIRSHEFHYYDSTNNGDSCHAVKANKSREWDCIYSENNIFAGFPHLYLRGYQFMIKNLIDFLEEMNGYKNV